MSKQSEAKAAQGYIAKPVPKTCMNCQHYKVEVTQTKSAYSSYIYNKESNLRCRLGGFAVKKMATCNEFIAAEKSE